MNSKLYPFFAGDPRCPVASFEKMVSKLSPFVDDLWQRPLECFNPASNVWYYKYPISKDTLGHMMNKISELANLSYTYTNHCVRATNLSVLDAAGFDARHLMANAGIRSESTIRSYSNRLSESRRASLSDTCFAYAIGIDTEGSAAALAGPRRPALPAPPSFQLQRPALPAPQSFQLQRPALLAPQSRQRPEAALGAPPNSLPAPPNHLTYRPEAALGAPPRSLSAPPNDQFPGPPASSVQNPNWALCGPDVFPNFPSTQNSPTRNFQYLDALDLSPLLSASQFDQTLAAVQNSEQNGAVQNFDPNRAPVGQNFNWNYRNQNASIASFMPNITQSTVNITINNYK